MADPEHLAILKQGVGAWNKWRLETSQIRRDLREADLGSMDLCGVDLCSADLSLAKLSNADLTFANLSGANLTNANLRLANLRLAKLSGANLSGADLGGAEMDLADLSRAKASGADLSGADLSGAKLVLTDLSGANLTHASFRSTILADTNLSGVIGLDSIIHGGPSSISIDTFFHSRGRIPEIFLRGAGVPDIFIQFVASLAGTAFQLYSCFISYSTMDNAFVQRLYADLQGKGVRCWFAPEDLKIGTKFRLEIDEAIRIHDKLLLVLSEHSVSSDWVEKEVETAFEKERKEKRLVLFPIRLDDAVMKVDAGWAADVRRTRHIGDFRKWKDHDAYAKSFDRLLRDLKSEK